VTKQLMFPLGVLSAGSGWTTTSAASSATMRRP
jgi:hypothetical protein